MMDKKESDFLDRVVAERDAIRERNKALEAFLMFLHGCDLTYGPHQDAIRSRTVGLIHVPHNIKA